MRKNVVTMMAVMMSAACLNGCSGTSTTATTAATTVAETTEVETTVVETTAVETIVAETSEAETTAAETVDLEDGTYEIDVTLGGGSGKTTVESPAVLTIAGDQMTAVITWSSANYDYMIVDDEKYLPVNTEGNSMFEIPVRELDAELDVIGDTVAMSKPREIEYTLTFHSNTAKAVQ